MDYPLTEQAARGRVFAASIIGLVLGLLIGFTIASFAWPKETAAPKPEIHKGMVWEFKADVNDPFEKSLNLTVLEVNGDYVKTMRPDGSTVSFKPSIVQENLKKISDYPVDKIPYRRFEPISIDWIPSGTLSPAPSATPQIVPMAEPTTSYKFGPTGSDTKK